MKKITLWCLPFFVIGCLLLSACGSEEETSSTSPSSSTATSATVISGGGTLKLMGTDPTTLDPAVASDANSHDFIVQIFSGLVKLEDNLEPAPDIAGTWDISQDGRTYTFHLRPDVVYQDGRQVTAADFKYSFERACDPATGSYAAATYLGDIVGAREKLAGAASEVSGVQVIDDATLQITIDAPKSYFLAKLTYPTAMVVDRYNVAQGGNWWRTPNGTGPFKLASWQQSSSLVLERNDKYYGQMASLESVQYQMYSGLQMSLYDSGSIDVASVSVSYIDTITDPSGPYYSQYQASPQLSFSWIGFNTTKPPFDDVNIRQAFTLAIDKDKIIRLTLRDLVQRADGILPPGIPGYDKDLAGLGYDVARAKALITASKYGSAANLPQITLTTSGYGGLISQYLEAVITQWRDNLGVEVNVRQMEPDRYVYHLKDEADNLYDMGWIADYPHPQDFLDVLFHTGADNNFGMYSNMAVDALLDKAGVETDTTKSLETYQQAEKLLVDDAAVIPLWFGRNLILVKPYVEGYELNAMGYVMLNQVKLKEH